MPIHVLKSSHLQGRGYLALIKSFKFYFVFYESFRCKEFCCTENYFQQKLILSEAKVIQFLKTEIGKLKIGSPTNSL